MINDSHLHFGWSEEVLRGFDENSFSKFLKENNINNCFAFPIFNKSSELMEEYHSTLLKMNRVNNGIKPLYWLKSDPLSLHKALEDIKGNYYGIKYHPAYEATPISHPLFEIVLDEINKLGKTVLVHCGMYNNGAISSNTSYLHAVIAAAKYKNIKFILGHMGGSTVPIIKEVCLHVRGINNIWLETSGITSPLAVDHAVNHIGAKKVLFGSDSPWCSFKAMYHNVVDSNISEEDKRLILHDNFYDLI